MPANRLGLALGAAGTAALAASVGLRPPDARAAASQVWPAFVLVSGLLLIGLVADDDGLFEALGSRLAAVAPSGAALFAGAVVLVTSVTAVLNLDTSVAFLTPVFVHTARRRRAGETPLLCGCLLLSNAGSLYLPGSNLTNLIVLGRQHVSGTAFLARMWAPALAGTVVTAAVVGLIGREALRGRATLVDPPSELCGRVGSAAVLAASVLVLLLPSPALPVAGVGVGACALHLWRRRAAPRRVLNVLGLPVLLGLFGTATALGTLGRAWRGPAELLGHLGTAATAAAAAVASVVFNNLPAASLLSAQAPPRPLALLLGLNLGPNLFVSGSLAWLLWLRSARAAGADPSVGAAARLGAVAVPLSLVAAVAALTATGGH